MGDILRRRGMMVEAGSSPSGPSLIYELSAPTSTAGYDTNILLFDEPKSFTILCEAYFKNYSWTSNNYTIFGLSTWNNFHMGSVRGYNDYVDGAVETANANRYTALAMNMSGEKKCTSLFARSNSYQTQRMAVRYNHTTRKIEGATKDRPMPTSNWYTMSGDLYSLTSITLNNGSAGSTINVFKIYNGLLTDTEINNFLNG